MTWFGDRVGIQISGMCPLANRCLNISNFQKENEFEEEKDYDT